MDEKRSPDWIVGLIVKVKTSLGEEVEGEIFSFDNNTNCVVLIERHKHSTIKKNFRLLKTSFVKEIQYLGKAENSDFELEPPPISVGRVRQKEYAAIRSMKEEISRIGVGVTQEAQEIFNALARTLPCKWSKESITVFDDVTIDPPYAIENCRGPTAVSVERVKKVLEGERRRLRLQLSTNSPTSSQTFSPPSVHLQNQPNNSKTTQNNTNKK